MLHSIINGEENIEYYLSILKQISENSYYDKEIRDEVLHFLSIN